MIRTRQHHDTGIRWHSSVNPNARVVRITPSPVAWILGKQAKQARRLSALKTTARAVVAAGMLALLIVHVSPAMTLQAPPVPQDEQVCGSSVLNGPSSAPGGAVTVPAGDNSAEFQNPLPTNTTYYFATGTHTFATGSYGVFNTIAPGSGDVFTGAPGAILDGDNYYNHYAFEAAEGVNNVTIEYLTIQHYNAPGGDGTVQLGQGENWVIQYDTVQDNLPGAGVYLGSDDTIQDSCLTQNGEYGFAAYTTYNTSPVTGGPVNDDVSGNEISYNDVCNWEHVPGFPITPPAGCGGSVGNLGCGCSGAGKFWETLNSVYDGNYEHNNYASGAWWDTNNAGADIEGNYIADEWGSLTYEISYNFLLKNNIFVDDAWGAGAFNPGFPETAVYINGSGSDSRVASNYSTVSDVVGNQFYDNWGGIVVYETADRFCSSVANSSTGICTLVNPLVATIQTCANTAQGPVSSSYTVRAPSPAGRRTPPGGGTSAGQNFFPYIERAPYYSDCRWKAQNVQVSGNLFDYLPGNIQPSLGIGCTYAHGCGFNGLFSNYGITPPYLGYLVPQAITYTQNDLFSGNTYCGPWEYEVYDQGQQENFATWQGSPYDQDPGSTLNGGSCYTHPVPPPNTVNRTITIPIKIGGGSR